jgi:hypothetical protein
MHSQSAQLGAVRTGSPATGIERGRQPGSRAAARGGSPWATMGLGMGDKTGA